MTPSQPTQPVPPSNGSSDWTLADLIDLEVLIQEDAETAPQRLNDLRQRDRAIGREFPCPPGALPTRRSLFLSWLKARRAERFRGHVSIGEEVLSLLRWIRIALFALGLLAAHGVVWGMLLENEVSGEPANVVAFFLVCIAFPFVLTLYGFWVSIGQKAFPKLPAAPAFVRGTLFELLQPLLRKAALRMSASLGQERRLNAQTLLGALKQRVDSRKGAIGAMAFQTVQTFGVAFTAGIVVFTLLNCLPHSRAFGWQTTDQRITPELVHAGVKALARPWSWLQPEGTGFPTLRQVEQTQFVRFGDRTVFRDSKAASAWASFLIWAALCYGFIPRLVLNRLTARHVRAALRGESFDALRFDPLWERLTLTRGTFTPPETAAAGAKTPSDAVPDAGSPDIQAAACRLVLPQEIHTPQRVAAIGEWVKNHKGWPEPDLLFLPEGLRFTEEIRTIGEKDGRMAMLIVQESFMPPMQQNLDFLRHVRSRLGARDAILVGLIGKPDGTPLARPPRRIDAEIWRKKIVGLGDPNIEVFSFLTPE